MRFYGKSEETAKRILSVFQSGSLPAALAPVFIHRRDNVPCRAWSWSNQLLTALSGTADARGFRQWQEAGRSVRKGSKAFQILGPIMVRKSENRGTSYLFSLLLGLSPWLLGLEHAVEQALEFRQEAPVSQWAPGSLVMVKRLTHPVGSGIREERPPITHHVQQGSRLHQCVISARQMSRRAAPGIRLRTISHTRAHRVHLHVACGGQQVVFVAWPHHTPHASHVKK